MRRDPRALADDSFDLCVLGGGVNGLATARDAAQRGLKVALIEQGDFGGETSAGSLKILHGGLRYLQHLDFSRMTESIRERNALMRMAPHLVDPLGFLVPTTSGMMTGTFAMRAAMLVNDVVGWKRNRGILDREQHLPPGRILSPAELKERAPGLPGKGVTGAALFYDAHMRNSDRFTLSFALSAARDGAVLANRTRGLGFEVGNGSIRALKVEDLRTGERFEVRARLYAAMTGPWRDLLPGLLPGEGGGDEVVKSAGIQILTERGICDNTGLAIPAGEVDPEAKLQRGGRHYFSTPWQGRVLWGTTDKPYRGRPEDWRIRREDIETFVDEINAGLPGLDLKLEEVKFVFGGLRMTNAENRTTGSKVARRYAISDHRDDLGLDNLISMDGIKYTACRIMAEKATDLCLEKLGDGKRPCRTADTVLAGGEFETRKTLEAEIRVAVPPEWPNATVRLLAESYGSDWPVIWNEGQSPDLLPDGRTPERMVEVAVREEMALGLEDVMLRRTPLGVLGRPDPAVTDRVGEIMRDLLGWSEETLREEKRILDRRYDYE